MRYLRLTERMLDAIRPLRPNEVHVFLRLALMCRKPYAGDPQRGIPPTPADEVLRGSVSGPLRATSAYVGRGGYHRRRVFQASARREPHVARLAVTRKRAV